jgi:hypothetical protein
LRILRALDATRRNNGTKSKSKRNASAAVSRGHDMRLDGVCSHDIIKVKRETPVTKNDIAAEIERIENLIEGLRSQPNWQELQSDLFRRLARALAHEQVFCEEFYARVREIEIDELRTTQTNEEF